MGASVSIFHKDTATDVAHVQNEDFVAGAYFPHGADRWSTRVHFDEEHGVGFFEVREWQPVWRELDTASMRFIGFDGPARFVQVYCDFKHKAANIDDYRAWLATVVDRITVDNVHTWRPADGGNVTTDDDGNSSIELFKDYLEKQAALAEQAADEDDSRTIVFDALDVADGADREDQFGM